MKKYLRALLSLAFLGGVLCGTANAEENRIIVDTPNGQNSCVLGADGSLSDCRPLVAEVRQIVDTPNGPMNCLWQDGGYSDCQPVAQENPQGSSGLTAEEEAKADAIAEAAMAQQQQQVYEETATTDASPSYSSSGIGYWENDYDIPSGLTWGIGFGWFGQVYEGKSEENGFSFGGDIGFKTKHFGLSADLDISVSPTDKKFEDLWTFSFSGLLMMYFPLTYNIEQTIGFGVGYTGWSLDYEYTTHTLHYNWYDGYYVEDRDHSKTIDSGGWLSLKLKGRLDIVADDVVVGLEILWIPWINTDKKGKVREDGTREKAKTIVNNIIGIQLHIGGIVSFD